VGYTERNIEGATNSNENSGNDDKYCKSGSDQHQAECVSGTLVQGQPTQNHAPELRTQQDVHESRLMYHVLASGTSYTCMCHSGV